MRLPITRRQLLQRLGALGGASLMMGAMDVWDLNGQASGARPELRGSRGDTRVLVLGGGLSGLIVAYELRKLDYDVRVLEARHEVGGLMWTVKRGSGHTEIGGENQVCNFDEGQYANVGAWRIPNADKGILDYCRELEVPLEVFLNWSNRNVFYEEGDQAAGLAGQKVTFGEVKADMWGYTSELLNKAVSAGNIDSPLSEQDSELLVEFLVSAGALHPEELTYNPPSSRGSRDPHDWSDLLQSRHWSRVRSIYQGTGGTDPIFQPIGGMQQIPYAFHRALGDVVALNTEVLSIRQSEQEVSVMVRDTQSGEEREERADYCACCLPMSILQRIDAGLSSEMKALVDESGHSNSAKMGLQMRRRFWEEDEGIFGGHLWSRSLGLGEFSYPSNDYFTEKGVLLGYYGGGTRNGLDEMSVSERVNFVLSQASKVHPQIREEFESAYSVWWDKVPYSMGAYARTASEEDRARLQEADGRMFLGSAGVSARPAWLEGAVQAAWHTVGAIHERATGDSGA